MLLCVRIVDEASYAVATLIIAMRVEIGLAILVELRHVIRHVRIVDPASGAMASIVLVVETIIAGRVMAIVFSAINHPLHQRANHCSCNDGPGIVTAIVIHPGIVIEPVTTTVMITADIRKDA